MLMIIFYAFLAYILYRLVFHFIIPVYRTVRRVKKGFREMNERMNTGQPGDPVPGGQQPNRPQPGEAKPRVGEYIDFEEIK
jgi:hypothetical protein